MRSTLLHDRVIKLSKAKVHGYSDSVLCLGKMHPQPLAVDEWKERLEYLLNSNEYQELFGIDGEPFEFSGTHHSGTPPRDSDTDANTWNQTR